MTILHAGGKFGKGGYKVSGGLHGVGISVVNALSEGMITRVKRDGNLYEMRFERGITVQKLKKIGKADETGTFQWFKPDPEIFETLDLHWDILQKRLRELAFLNRGLSITLRDERGEEPRERTYKFDGGIVSFVECLNENKEALHPVISTNGERDGIDVEVRDAVDRHLQRADLQLRQQHQHDRRRHAPARLPPSRDASRQLVREEEGHAQRRRWIALDRRLHGRPHRDRLGEARRPAIRRPDQDQARQREACAGSSTPGQRAARFLLRRESEDRARHRREVHAGAARARSREKSARPLAAQERARRHGSARQARRLQEHRSRRRARSSWSRAIRPAAPPRAAAIRTRKRSFRCAARSSTSRSRASTRCSSTKRFAR